VADNLNAGPYQPVIDASAAKYGIDPAWLTRLLHQENGFRPTGTSPAGAQGIAQFMPGTAARYGVNVNDPSSSIDGAAHYLSDNLKMFGGNQGLATAAYNWGEGNVQKWLKSGGGVPKETQQYVSNITGTPITTWAGAGGASSRLATSPPQDAAPSQAPGPIDPSIIARGGVSPPIPGAAPAPTPGTSIAGITPDQSKALMGDLSQLDKSMGGKGLGGAGGQTGGGEEPQPAPMGPGPPVHNMSNPAAFAPALWGNTLNSMREPAQWGATPPGQNPYANAGGQPIGQQFGMQLSSMQQMQQMMAMMGNPYGDAGYG
jgi:hypothetical protein